MRVPSSLSQNRVAMGSLWSTGLSSNFAFISIKFHSYPFISISHPINSTSPAPPSGRFALQRFKAAEMLSSFLAKRNEHAAVSKDMDMCCINMCIYIYMYYTYVNMQVSIGYLVMYIYVSLQISLNLGEVCGFHSWCGMLWCMTHIVTLTLWKMFGTLLWQPTFIHGLWSWIQVVAHLRKKWQPRHPEMLSSFSAKTCSDRQHSGPVVQVCSSYSVGV